MKEDLILLKHDIFVICYVMFTIGIFCGFPGAWDDYFKKQEEDTIGYYIALMFYYWGRIVCSPVYGFFFLIDKISNIKVGLKKKK